MMNDQGNNKEPKPTGSRAKRLYRSRRQRMIGGVCGGLAEYFAIDPTLLRIALVVLAFAGGSGIIVYIIGLIIIPEGPVLGEEEAKQGTEEGVSAGPIWGVVLIVIGIIVLIHKFGWFHWPIGEFWFFTWKLLWPLILIFIGVLLLRSRSGEEKDKRQDEGTDKGQDIRKLTRLRRERMVGGVCGGIADYFRLDPTLVRLLWAFGTIVSYGLGILAYIILLIVLPEEEVEISSKV